MSTTATRTRSRTRRRTTAWPMPLAAPVTTATRPASPLRCIRSLLGKRWSARNAVARVAVHSSARQLAVGARSLDDPACSREHGGRDCQAECPRGLQVHHELELRRTLDREICGPSALQNPVDVVRETPVRFGQEGTIRAECAALREDWPAGDHGYALLHGEVDDG